MRGESETRDEVLGRIVAELRRPLPFDPSIDAGALRRIRAGHGRAGRRRPRAWLGVAAVAALAASVFLAIGVRRNAGTAGPAASRPVLLRLVAPASSGVVVVGDFNDWNPAATPLRPTGRGGEWTVELELRPGRYRYTFLVDGREWVSDPSEPRAPDSDYGTPMSVLTVS